MPTENETGHESKLDHALARFIDSREGYAHAAALIDVPDLAAAFTEISARREAIIGRLSALHAASTDADPPEEGTPEGAAHRWWMGLRGKMTSETLHPVLSECIRGEKSLAEAIRAALAEDTLPAHIASFLKGTLAEVEMAVEHFEWAIQSRAS